MEGCLRRTSATEQAERLKVRGSMSAKTGRAPARRMALVLAKNVNGLVRTASDTASPGALEVLLPMPAAASASHMASDPLAQPTAKSEEQAAPAAASSEATRGPRMKVWESQTRAIAARICSRKERYWREKSTIGTGFRVGLATKQ